MTVRTPINRRTFIHRAGAGLADAAPLVLPSRVCAAGPDEARFVGWFGLTSRA